MTPIRRNLLSTGVAITLGVLAAAVQAEAPSAPAPAKAPSAAAAAKAPSVPAKAANAGQTQESMLEPAAVDALKRMGEYLRSLKSFEVDATTTD